MKKFSKLSKKIISLFIAVLMVFSTMPLSAFAWSTGLTFAKKNTSWTDYPGKYSAYISNGVDYAGIVLKEVDNSGVITVQRGEPFSITLSCGKWTKQKASNGVPQTDTLSWYFGESTDYVLSTRDAYGNGEGTKWKAFLGDDTSKEIQSNITGEFATATNGPLNKYRATSGDGGTNEAYGVFEFTTSSFPQLNTPGEYTVRLAPTIIMNTWTSKGWFQGSEWRNTKGWGAIDWSIANENPINLDGRTISITVKVVADYEFRDINGNKVGNTIKAAGATDALKQAPANTAAKIKSNGDGTHNVTNYFWSSTPTNNVFTENPDVNSNVPCSGGAATCTQKKICEVCGREYGELAKHIYSLEPVEVKANGDDNGYKYIKCLNCDAIDTSIGVNGYVYIDVSSYWETYNAQLTQSQAEIDNTAKYTSDSIKAVQDIIDEVAPVKDSPTKSQRYIQDKTRALATATNSLILNKYSITVNYVDENGNDLAVGEGGTTSKTYPAVNYGSIQNVVAPTNYNKVDYAVYKWTRNGTGGDIISGLNSSSLDVVVKGASTYYVFLKNTSVDESQASGNAVITLNNKSNKVYDIGYVDLNENTPVSVSNNTITIGGVTLTAPNYSFYNITGFDVNGKIITGTDTVSITKNTVIRPVYEAKQTVRITRASANILINGKNDDSVDVEWNKKIVMTYNGAVPNGQVVIWKDGNGNVLAQGTTYTFYSNSNVTISASVEASAPAEPTASIGLFSYDPTDNKVTVVNNFFVPDRMTVTKAGVILSTKNSTRDALIAQTNGKFEGGTESFTSTGNQIRISVSRTATTSFTMHALAYVVVKDENGNTETYYAPTVRSITYPAGTPA